MSLLVRSNLQAYAAFRKKLLQETRQQAATIEEQLKAVGGTNVRVVELARDAQGLGMCVEKNDRLGVVMVTQVVPGGAAGRSSQIFAGDAIVSVDGHAVQNWSQAETLSALKSRSRLTLVLAQIDAVRF